MKCLFLSDGLLYPLSRADHSVFITKNTFFQFVDELANHFNRLTLFAPVAALPFELERSTGLFELRPSGTLQIAPAGDFASVNDYYRRFIKIWLSNRSALQRLVSEHDVMILRLPSMNAVWLQSLIIRCGIPYATYVVGNQAAIVREGGKYKGLKQLAAEGVACLHKRLSDRLVSNAKVSFFLGAELSDQFSPDATSKEQFLTSLVRDSDIVPRKPRATGECDKKTLLFVGRMAHEKGLEYLLPAVRLLVNKKIPVELLVVGDGSERNAIERQIQLLEIGNNVRLLGFVKFGSALNKLYERAQVFVLPSLSEGIPKVILEAMAKGVPVVATDVGGIPAVVRHEDNGLLVPPHDARALAAAIESVLLETGLADRLRKQGYQFVGEHTLERQAEKLSVKIKRMM
jgi:glycosyltransferase involved in cell wall biosynthesis